MSMGTITLDEIHKDLVKLKKDMEHIKRIIDEDFELNDDVVKDIRESRKRPKNEFISHEEMKKEFG